MDNNSSTFKLDAVNTNVNKYIKGTCPSCGTPLSSNADFIMALASKPSFTKNGKIFITAFCNTCGKSCGGSFSIPSNVFKNNCFLGKWK
jgi:transcription elongation factor Elf1